VHVSFCGSQPGGENVNRRSWRLRAKIGSKSDRENGVFTEREFAMDESTARLKQKLDRLMRETAATAVALSRADGTIRGIPHYSVFELHAHNLGRELSREIQAQQMTETVAEHAWKAKCPACGEVCELRPCQRPVTSIDGSLPLQELKGHCDRCRRDFFPSAGSVGV
jgi:hypothetical protein